MSTRIAASLALMIASLALFTWPIIVLFTSGSTEPLPFGLIFGGILLNAATYNLTPELLSRTASIGLMLVVLGFVLIGIDAGIAQLPDAGRYDHVSLGFGILAIVAGAPCFFVSRFQNTRADR